MLMLEKQHLYNSRRLEDRAVTELIGIAKGMIADGIINEQEANFLVHWLEQNSALSVWPFDVINRRVADMLSDGIIDAEERRELFSLLESLVGGKSVSEHITSFATTLPLTKPEPSVTFFGYSFCFTGKFAFGQRKDCEKAILELGGECKDKVTKDLDYLVIGLMGNEDWMHSAFGRKIQQAIDYNKKGRDIKIISEETWANALAK